MKKLTWALLSLMLFLGMGMAFAQDTEGEGDGGGETVTVAKPTFKVDGEAIENGAAVIYGSRVTIAGEAGTKIIYTTSGTDPVLSSTTFSAAKATQTVKVDAPRTIKAIAVQGATFEEAVASEVASVQVTCKLSASSFTPETNSTVKQGAKITCTEPEELEDETVYFLIYATGDSQEELTTDEETLTAVQDAIETSLQGSSEPEYPASLASLGYKVAGAYQYMARDWYFPAEAPETDGTFKIRGRVVALGGTAGNIPVYGDMMYATYTVEGEGGGDDDVLAKPTFSEDEGAVEAGQGIALIPAQGAQFALYVIDGDEADLTYEGFQNFKCFLYDPSNDDNNMPKSLPVEIYKETTIKAVSAKMTGMDYQTGTMTFAYSEVATATYTVQGGDQPNKIPTLTVSPAKVYPNSQVYFSCTMNLKQTEEDLVGFVIRGKSDAAIESIDKLEYRLNETDDWTAFTAQQLARIKNGGAAPAIPGNEENADSRLFPKTTTAKTVYYCMTLSANDEGGNGGGDIFSLADDDATEGDATEDEEETAMPVIAFELGRAMDGLGYLVDQNEYSPLARTPLTYEEAKPAAPTFDPESGATVDFGAQLTLTSFPEDAYILYTTDGTEPTEENGQYYTSYFGAKITGTTIKAVAILNGVASEVATATYTINKIEATLALTPANEDTVGLNVGTGFEFSIENWQNYPATVYYTVDGETEPSKAAYDAQTDKENGAIKMLKNEIDEYGYGVQDGDGHFIALTFTGVTQLKAVGYMTLAGQEVVTPLIDKTLQVKTAEAPVFNPLNGAVVAVGDSIVIENPHPYPAQPDIEMPDWDNGTEEEWAAYEEAWNKYNEEVAKIPATQLYFSFNGTAPTKAAYDAQEKLDDYAKWSVFRTGDAADVTIYFQKDEQGFYAHVPSIIGSYPTAADTIRFDGKFSVQVLAISKAVAEEGGEGGEGGDIEVQAAKAAGEEAFYYGSEFVKASYYTAPATLTFDPVSGSEVDENTAVSITCSDAAADIFYMMFESEEAAKAAAWDQEKAELYSAELKPVLSREKNTIKAAYAREGAEAIADGFFYATYKVKELPAITLTFDPASGSTVTEGTEVTVTANREVEIFYNLYADKAAADADETFMANAKEVKEDGKPVITKAAPYLRCGVTDKGEMKYFDATYTVEVSNEDLELAGVSVYPNPSNGEFHLDLPVAATVEVFAANGVLTQRFSANEGNVTLNINRSGIYFLRITGEGRTTVKRLIVR